jgi:polysaccharide biosynthesis protein PslH
LKILWVKAGGLVPLDTGGKIRSYHILHELSRHHEVTFFTFYEEHANDCHAELSRVFARVIRHPLRLPRKRGIGALISFAPYVLSSRPYQIIRYCQPQVASALDDLCRTEEFDVIVCDFLVAAGIIPWNIPCPKVLFTHNVETLIFKRHFETAHSPLWKAVWWREYQTTARAERHYLNLADHVLTVSDTDRNCFAQVIEPAKISVIPTGVDLDFFRPSTELEQHTLVFTGSMDWMPNEDAIFHFAHKVLPRIRAQVPDISLLVVGRRPSSRLLELARTIPCMQVTGAVEDIRPYVQRGSVYIVPLRVGSGTRLKIFEAMAMGKAVVSTRIGAEGLPVRSGENILLADDPEDFANAVVGLLMNHAKRNELGQAARELVVRKHGWSSVAQDFELILEALVSGAKKIPTGSAVGSWAPV